MVYLEFLTKSVHSNDRVQKELSNDTLIVIIGQKMTKFCFFKREKKLFWENCVFFNKCNVNSMDESMYNFTVEHSNGLKLEYNCYIDCSRE